MRVLFQNEDSQDGCLSTLVVQLNIPISLLAAAAAASGVCADAPTLGLFTDDFLVLLLVVFCAR